MSLKNLLDLRKKADPQIQVVERYIFQKRSWKTEVLRTFSVIITASLVIWGISNADTLLTSTSHIESKNFSVIGIVSDIGTTTLSLHNARGSNDTTQTTYTFDTNTVTKIETKSYAPLTLSDINAGDKIVVQGVDDQGNILIKRIISFSATSPKEETKTATTTPEATTTETTTSTTTDSTSSTTVTTSPSLIDTVKDVVSNAIGVITGTASTLTEEGTSSTATSTDEAATTDAAATTTTEDTSSSTPEKPSITQTVTDAVSNVVSAITGTTSSTDTPLASDPLPTPTPAPSDTLTSVTTQ